MPLLILIIEVLALWQFWDNIHAYRNMRDEADLNNAIYYQDKNQDPGYIHHKTKADLIMQKANKRLIYAGIWILIAAPGIFLLIRFM